MLVNIDVDDLPKAADFYCRALGLCVTRYLGQEVIELSGESEKVYLLKKAEGTPAIPDASQHRTYMRHWTPVHLDFVVEDIDAAVERAKAAGAQLEGAVRSHNWGRIAQMADPFGHGFCLIQFLGRGYDEIATPAP